VKLLLESIGAPAPPRSAPAPPRTGPPAPSPEARRPGPDAAGAADPGFPLGRCRRCNGPLGLSVDPGCPQVRVSCGACGTSERDAEPHDLTACARAQDLRCGCGAELRGRRGPRGLFLGCASYPACRSTRRATALVRG